MTPSITASLKIECGWCSKVIQDGPPAPVSTGICDVCLHEHYPEAS